MAPAPPKRPRGRPRNEALDALQRELAITRRHASTILREQRNSGGGTSEKAPSPLASARLAKTQTEIRWLETKVRSAELEERALRGELLFADEARELSSRAHQGVANVIGNMPKTLAPRLAGQPQKAAEKTLTEWADSLLALLEQAIGAVQTPHTL